MTFSGLSRLIPAGALAFALFAAPAAQAASEKDKPGADPVVATVNGGEIHLSDVKALHADFPQPQVRQLPLERIYKPMLELLIQIRLLSNEAREAGLADDPAVTKRVDAYRNRTLRDVYLERFVDKRIDDAALKEAYEAFKKDFKGGEEIRARHILVKDKKQAMEIIAALDKGEDFETLAKEKSIGPSKAKGGDLGWFSRKQMVKPFADAAYELKKDEVSKAPVKTQFGWHVIQVTDRRQSGAPKLEEVKDKLRQELGQKIAVAELERLQKAAEIKRFGMDGEPMQEEPAPAPNKGPVIQPEK